LVHRALHDFPADDRDIFFIENVGNLVCPAIYDLGQAANVVALSVTEGEDKPLKYPVMFQNADLVLLTKIDLIPHLDFDVAAVEDAIARVMPEANLLKVSAKTGEGIDAWLQWLEQRRPAAVERPAHGHQHEHSHEHDHEHD
jgi:hydrogenase nickel incorporation protein HypB